MRGLLLLLTQLLLLLRLLPQLLLLLLLGSASHAEDRKGIYKAASPTALRLSHELGQLSLWWKKRGRQGG